MTPALASAAPVRISSAEFEAGATTLGGLPAAGLPEIAFAGRSNVGKSSLMNALVQRSGLVRTSSTPGCTRALNLFSVTLQDGTAYRMVDLPGYGYAKLSKTEKSRWGKMIEGYLEERPTLRAVVLLVDLRRGFEEDDGQLAAFVRSCRAEGPAKEEKEEGEEGEEGEEPSEGPIEVILVATKLDKLPLSKRKPALAAFRRETGLTPIGFSAVTGEGRDALWARIRKAAPSPPGPVAPPSATPSRAKRGGGG